MNLTAGDQRSTVLLQEELVNTQEHAPRRGGLCSMNSQAFPDFKLIFNVLKADQIKGILDTLWECQSSEFLLVS